MSESSITFKGITFTKLGEKLKISKGNRVTTVNYKEGIEKKGNIETFTKWLGEALVKFAPDGEPFIVTSDIPELQKQLINFLTVSPLESSSPGEISLEESEFLKRTLEEAKTKPIQVKTEVKTEQEPPKAKTTSDDIVKAYETLKSEGKKHEEITAILAQKFSITIDAIETMLPKTGIMKHIVEAKTESLTSFEMTEELLNIVIKQFDQLSPDKKDMINKLAKIYRRDIKSFLPILVTEARKNKPPRSWLAHATALCIEHGLYQIVKGRGYHVLLCDAKKVWEALISDKVEVKIDYCYKLGEETSEFTARILARSVSTKLSKLPKNDQTGSVLKLYNYIEPIGEMTAIPKSYQVFAIPDNMKTIAEMADELKVRNSGYYVISGEVHDFNSKGEEYWFLKIIDGSEPHEYFLSIAFGVPNHFQIDENILRNCIGKTVLTYAFCQLKKGSAETGFKLDSVIAFPEAIFMG